MGLLQHLFGQRSDPIPFCSVVVAAAGNSARMCGTDKIMADLGESPLICHTISALEHCARIHEIIVVTREDLIVPISTLCREYGFEKVTKIVAGGSTRTESVSKGLQMIDRRAELAAIHDGARPFVTQEVLNEVLSQAAKCSAAAPAVPVKDTIKRGQRGCVEETLDRSSLYAVQTPQVFQPELIRAALHRAMEDGAVLTDDCAAVERIGMTVRLTSGTYENIKVTTPTDLLFGEAILEQRERLMK